MSHGVCPLCGKADFDPFRMNLLRCSTCGLVMDQTVWVQSANQSANALLEEEWFGDGYDPQQSPWVRLFENRNNRRTFGRIASLDLPGKRLLEIGVGSGSFLQFMVSRGFDVLGCDLSKAICKLVQQKYGIPMHCGYVSELDDQLQFDIVVINHILEHVADPVGLLQAIKRRMVSGGALHVAVPNVASFGALLPGWTSYEPFHLLYFAPETLRRTVEHAGFVVEWQTTHESFSGWFLAVLRTLLKIHQSQTSARNVTRKDRATSLVEHVYRFAMVGTGVLSFPLRFVQARLGKGDEVVLIARVK